jgi:hypothetical protein
MMMATLIKEDVNLYATIHVSIVAYKALTLYYRLDADTYNAIHIITEMRQPVAKGTQIYCEQYLIIAGNRRASGCHPLHAGAQEANTVSNRSCKATHREFDSYTLLSAKVSSEVSHFIVAGSKRGGRLAYLQAPAFNHQLLNHGDYSNAPC